MVLIGEAADQIEHDLGDSVEIVRANDLADAIEEARQYAVSGDAVLLSPLCASFDSFENFEDRGDTFRQLVKSITSDDGGEDE